MKLPLILFTAIFSVCVITASAPFSVLGMDKTMVLAEADQDTSDIYMDYLKYLKDKGGNTNTPIQNITTQDTVPMTDENIQAHWAAEAINNCYAGGMINLSENGKIRPNDPILRGELAYSFSKWIQKNKTYLDSIGFDYSIRPTSFGDVTAAGAFYKEITEVTGRGIIKGYSSNNFGPTDYLTREQLCAIWLNLLLKLEKGYVNQDYVDKLNVDSYLYTYIDYFSVSPWARTGVSVLTEQKYLSGYVDGTFRPKGAVTRAEAYQIFNLAEKMMASYYFYNNTVTYQPNATIKDYYTQSGYYKTEADYYAEYAQEEQKVVTPEQEAMQDDHIRLLSYKVRKVTSRGFQLDLWVNYAAHDQLDTELVYGYSLDEPSNVSTNTIDDPPNTSSFDNYHYRSIKLDKIEQTYTYNKDGDKGCGYLADISIDKPGTYYVYFMIRFKDEVDGVYRKRVIIPEESLTTN